LVKLLIILAVADSVKDENMISFALSQMFN